MRTGATGERRGRAVVVVSLLVGAILVGVDRPSGAAYPAPENGFIAYTNLECVSRCGDDADREVVDVLHLVGPDGIGDRVVTTHAEEPAWSPDGQTLAYNTPSGRIFVIKPDRTGRRGLTTGHDPTWSRDGSQLAFVRRTVRCEGIDDNPLPGFDLMTIGLDGSDARLRYSAPCRQVVSDPVWSPVDDRIAFVKHLPADSDNERRHELFMLASGDTESKPMTTSGGMKGKPDWAPDGSNLIYHWTRERCPPRRIDDSFGFPGARTVRAAQQGSGCVRTDIFRLPSTATPETPPESVTETNRFDANEPQEFRPAYSPDGTKIVFDRSGDRLFITNADGRNEASVPPSPSEPRAERTADWQPQFPDPPEPDDSGPVVTAPDDPRPPDRPPGDGGGDGQSTAPTLTLDRKLGPVGSVPLALGAGFTPGQLVTLVWSPGIGSWQVRADEQGELRVVALVLPKDVLGARSLRAIEGGEVVTEASFLVVPSTLQPGGFDRTGFFNRR